MSNADQLPFVGEDQLALPGLGPMVGERWRNVHTGTIVAVVGLEQRKHGWVTIRVYGNRQTLTIARFLKVFERIN